MPPGKLLSEVSDDQISSKEPPPNNPSTLEGSQEPGWVWVGGDASVTFRLWVGLIRESDMFVLILKQKKYTFKGRRETQLSSCPLESMA